MKNTVDVEHLNSLLADKQSADARLKKALKSRAFHIEEIDGKEDSGLFSERIVAVVSKGNSTTRLLEYADQVKTANKALLEYAPEYFSDKSNFFKEPTIIHNVRRVHIVTNVAISSHRIQGDKLASRLKSFVRVSKRKLNTELPENEALELKEKINKALEEIVFYTEHGDKNFRRRGQAYNDIQAVYHVFSNSKEKNKSKVQKAKVTAGGLIVVRHATCSDNDIIYSDDRATKYSVYDEANGFSCVLYPNATMYSEDEVELLRKHRQQNKNNR